MLKPGILQLAVGLGFLSIFVIALQCLPEELAGQRQIGRESASVYVKALGGVPEFAASRSWRVQQAQLTQCDDLLAPRYAAIATPQTRQRVTEACLQRADEVRRSSPTASLAHLIRARALVQMNRADSAMVAFSLAQQTAPSEGWLAARRLRFAMESVGAAASNMTASAIDVAAQADVLTVLQTDAYLPLLVQIYQVQPVQRAWLLGVIEQGPEARKHRFLKMLRRSLTVASAEKAG